jgi:hypothetical protein
MKRFSQEYPWRCERVATRSGDKALCGGRWLDALTRHQFNSI